ncbi:hypothetical protein SB48_HM08orf05543 [Heyndrickxia coagulans]|uniref:Uncharacterized protein n=1 Tax=Heyndrickxia coagulans TaxID=1398 RepID=A0AAN0TAJ4_HEYCO|nr:hypothetical protein SB48_HM08orf05543 [Heyndrickxia coagulans]
MKMTVMKKISKNKNNQNNHKVSCFKNKETRRKIFGGFP